MMGYLFLALPVVLLAGSATAAAVGRSFRAGLWACAWAVVLAMPPLVAAWLAEALAWHQQRGQLLLDGEGGPGLGADLVGVTWATPSGGPWSPWRCRPCPWACSAQPPEAGRPAAAGPASGPVSFPRPEPRASASRT